jgi:hypothetical protein
VHLALSEALLIPDSAASLIKLNLGVRLARHLFGYVGSIAGARSETIGRRVVPCRTTEGGGGGGAKHNA